MNNGARTLALDASTTAVGWCVANGTHYESSGVFVPYASAWWNRVTAFHRWLGNLLIADGDIELVIYEAATGNKGNMHTNRLLGACEYAARIAVRDTSGRRRFVTVTASQVKAAGVCKSELWAAEAIVRDATNNARGLDAKYPGDEADAIGVWKAYLSKVGYDGG